MNASENIDALAAALAAAQAEFSPVGKSGRNTYDRYAYANLADYMAAAPPQTLAKHGLSIVESVEQWERLADHQTKAGGLEYVTHVTLAVRLLHISGQWVEIVAHGEGMDRADKSTYTATTGARKYGIACLLRLVTTDDPERADAKGAAHVETRTQTKAAPPQATRSAPRAKANAAAPMKSAKDASGFLVPLCDRPCEHAFEKRTGAKGDYYACSKCKAYPMSKPQTQKIHAMMAELKLSDDHQTAVKFALGVTSSRELSSKEASALIDWLDAVGSGAAIPEGEGPPPDVQAVQAAMSEGDDFPWNSPAPDDDGR